MPTATTLDAGPYADAYADVYADGYLGDGGYEPPPPRRRRRPGRRGGTALLGLLVAFGLHASLLLLWRTTRPPAAPIVGEGDGSGGISLTLVRGSAGGAFAPSPPSDSVDPEQQTNQAASDAALTPPATTSSGVDRADASATGAGHGAGEVGEAVDGGDRASAGAGYDPGAFASLAPLSFARATDPKLWEQVKRCLKPGVQTPLTLQVVIDDTGQFVDATKPVDDLASRQDAGEVEAIAAAVQALKDCGPYHGLSAGLGRPLTLVVPGSAKP